MTLHMIGNAHLDPVWLWRWPEGCAAAISTCWAAVDLLQETPGFIFTRGEAVVYRWIEEYEPALFAQIQRLVREGRWAIVNGWWVQPDCNLPDGEACIRQGLYGKAYFRSRFGVDVTVGYNVDSFGHAGTLPMLLRHTGFLSYVFMRPREHERTLPGPLFDWLAPDGSRVLAYRVPVAYQTARRKPPQSELDRLSPYDALAIEALAGRLPYFEEQAERLGYPLMCFYGVGNHGGGPTRDDLAVILAAQQAGHSLIFSDPARYFAAVADVSRPSVADELQYHAIGCYAAVSILKTLNRRAEAQLAQAEAASALAMRAAGAPYPRQELQRLWETLLFNQFHDILGGTSIQSATLDAVEALGGVVQSAGALLLAALRRLAATVAPAPHPEDAGVLIFNLSGTASTTPVTFEPWLEGGLSARPRRLLDHTGVEVPYQIVAAEGFLRGPARVLCMPRVPAFGYSLYRLVDGIPTPHTSSLKVTAFSLENGRWHLEIDPTTGAIAHLTDLRAHREIFSGPAHVALMVDDPSDTWSHGMDRFGVTGDGLVLEHATITERGPLRAVLEIRARGGASRLITTYMLHDDPDQPLEICVRLDWHERQRLLRLVYPLALSAPAFRYEVPYGSVERPADGREWPGQRWVLATGSDGYGLAFANNAKYSYAAYDSTFYITALRSPGYAHHDPYVLPPDADYPFTDQGEQTFTIQLLAGTGIDPVAAHRLAEQLTRPPTVLPHVSREGIGPHQASLLHVQSTSSAVTWLKAAEDGSDLVLRMLELSGREDTITVAGVAYPLSAHGLATLRITPAGRSRLSDGLES